MTVRSGAHALVVPWRRFQKGSGRKMDASCRDRTSRAVRDSETTNGTWPFVLFQATVP